MNSTGFGVKTIAIDLFIPKLSQNSFFVQSKVININQSFKVLQAWRLAVCDDTAVFKSDY